MTDPIVSQSAERACDLLDSCVGEMERVADLGDFELDDDALFGRAVEAMTHDEAKAVLSSMTALAGFLLFALSQETDRSMSEITLALRRTAEGLR